MPERLPQHKHCLSCGRATSPKKEYCSDDCETERIEMLQRKKKQLMMLYAVSVAVVIVAFVLAVVKI
jgi:predicted nucleic acid-binding Zn ribbon protein